MLSSHHLTCFEEHSMRVSLKRMANKIKQWREVCKDLEIDIFEQKPAGRSLLTKVSPAGAAALLHIV